MALAKNARRVAAAARRAQALSNRFSRAFPAAIHSAQKLSADTIQQIQMVSYGALKCIEANLTRGEDEMRVLKGTADVILALCVGGLGDADDRRCALAGRQALEQIEGRCGMAGPFKLLQEEKDALYVMLRVHDAQLTSADMTQHILLQAMDAAVERMQFVVRQALAS